MEADEVEEIDEDARRRGDRRGYKETRIQDEQTCRKGHKDLDRNRLGERQTLIQYDTHGDFRSRGVFTHFIRD